MFMYSPVDPKYFFLLVPIIVNLHMCFHILSESVKASDHLFHCCHLKIHWLTFIHTVTIYFCHTVSFWLFLLKKRLIGLSFMHILCPNFLRSLVWDLTRNNAALVGTWLCDYGREVSVSLGVPLSDYPSFHWVLLSPLWGRHSPPCTCLTQSPHLPCWTTPSIVLVSFSARIPHLLDLCRTQSIKVVIYMHDFPDTR